MNISPDVLIDTMQGFSFLVLAVGVYLALWNGLNRFAKSEIRKLMRLRISRKGFAGDNKIRPVSTLLDEVREGHVDSGVIYDAYATYVADNQVRLIIKRMGQSADPAASLPPGSIEQLHAWLEDVRDRKNYMRHYAVDPRAFEFMFVQLCALLWTIRPQRLVGRTSSEFSADVQRAAKSRKQPFKALV